MFALDNRFSYCSVLTFREIVLRVQKITQVAKKRPADPTVSLNNKASKR